VEAVHLWCVWCGRQAVGGRVCVGCGCPLAQAAILHPPHATARLAHGGADAPRAAAWRSSCPREWLPPCRSAAPPGLVALLAPAAGRGSKRAGAESGCVPPDAAAVPRGGDLGAPRCCPRLTW
jgi:hypothetical protein